MKPHFRKRPRPGAGPFIAPEISRSASHSNWQAQDVHLEIEYRALQDIIPPERQLKKHSPKQVAQIEASMRAFGNINPIVVDADYRIVVGVGRFLAAQSMKCATVPVIKVEHLSKAELRLYTLADNKLASLSTFDEAALAIELSELIPLDLPMAIEITGFDTVEIDNILLGTGTAANDATGCTDEISETDAGPPVSQLGDLYRLGEHLLLCADAEKAESYRRLLGDERARMVFSDNPYNVKIQGNVSGLGKVKHGEFVMGSGEMSKERFTEFLTSVFGHCAEFSLDGSIHFQCMDHRHLREMLDAGEAAYTEHKNLIVWDKISAGMGTFYRNQFELIFVWKAGKAPHVNNFGLGETGRYRSNIWRYPGVNAMGKGRLETLALHPTVKNLTMVTDAIRDVSGRGEIFLDPFCGSGTTLLAAERTGRKARCIELDPQYVDVTLRRWQAATGRQAIHVESGLSFDDLTDNRHDNVDGEA
jgi:DNA modification methylase